MAKKRKILNYKYLKFVLIVNVFSYIPPLIMTETSGLSSYGTNMTLKKAKIN